MNGEIKYLIPAAYVTVRKAAAATGLSEKAIRRKIEDGKWVEGREYRRAPDGGIFINLKGYERWVEAGTGSKFEKPVSGSNSHGMGKDIRNGSP